MTAPNGHDRGNVSSLEEARRRAAEKAKAEKRAARSASGGGANTLRDWIIAGLVVAMALGYIASLFAGASGVNGAMQ
jgi:F0F1-type ATP synthase assembly protein I